MASPTSREITAEVLEAFACTSHVASQRQANALGKRLMQLKSLFARAPKLWDTLKQMVGATGVLDLPRKIQRFMQDGKKYLSQMGTRLKESVPALRIYLDQGSKLPALGVWLSRLVDVLPPNIARTVHAIGTKAKTMADWVDEILSKNTALTLAGRAMSAAIFAFIWFNVMEISWDIPELIRGFTGGYSFGELLESLPESGIGFVLHVMFPGIPSGLLWNILLPATVTIRVAWLIAHDYIKPQGNTLIAVGVDNLPPWKG